MKKILGSDLQLDRFFISYNKEDKEWAEWIRWHLLEAGYEVFMQNWDTRPGNNYILAMHKAAETYNRTIAVLSSHYLDAEYTQPEWAAALNQDPTGEKRLLLPVRIEEIELKGLWLSIVYIDLVGLDEEEAKNALLEGVSFDKRLPDVKPEFPGKKSEIKKFETSYPIKGPIKKDPLKEWTILNYEIYDDNEKKQVTSSIRQDNSRVVEANTRNYDVYSNASPFLRSNQEGPQNDLAFYQELFKILLPLSYQDKLLNSLKINLKLDTNTIKIPWELAISSAVFSKYNTIPDRLNIIRQVSLPYVRILKGQENRKDETYTLIIGGADNPNYHLSPSVIQEGQAISNLLSSYGYPVVTNILSNALKIIASLFSHEYNIVHISGIGYWDIDTLKGGILIGENIILSPSVFEQMASLPELVFVNFGTQTIVKKSYLNEIDRRDSDYNALAANIATQLLEIGVKCIVVSSLPMDDISNFTFSVEFYKALIAGQKFSDAISKARIESMGDTKDVRSFGGFQCYGNIDFVLAKTQNKTLKNAPNNSNSSE